MNDKNLETTKANENEAYSLNDDRRVKVLSPSALVVKRFFRNRLAVLGLIMLVSMFVFSFVGGLVTPYGQDEQFYRYESQMKDYAGVVENKEFRYMSAEGQKFDSVLQAKFQLAYQKKTESFEYKDVVYDITEEGTDFYSISSNGTTLAIAFKDIVNGENVEFTFNEKFAALKAFCAGETAFSADGKDYTLDADHNILLNGEIVGYISRLVVSPVENGIVFTRDFKEALENAINDGYILHSSKGSGYITRESISQNIDYADSYKVMISKVTCEHAGEPDKDGILVVLSTTKVLNPKEVCTDSYLILGKFNNQNYANNLCSFLRTRFARFLLLQAVSSINLSKDKFCFVPMQDFNESWTDEKLYAKYSLTKDEIAFIESMIRPME